MRCGVTSVLPHTVELTDTVTPINPVHGEQAGHAIPEDLFIPAEALEIITQDFQGPLDLLLYLIRKNRFDALDIPVAQIAQQYARYIEVMKTIQLELAGEYLAMAATLAQIKSRLLLPPQQTQDDDDQDIDPRLELALRLQEYEKIKMISEQLDEHSRVGRDVFLVHAQSVAPKATLRYEQVTLDVLIDAFENILMLAESNVPIVFERESLNVKDKMKLILDRLGNITQLSFAELLNRKEGKAGLIVTFLAILELINTKRIYAVQAQQNEPIYLRRHE